MRRLFHLFNLGLAFLLVGGSLWAYPHLPARIPRHFGLGGAADAYWAATLVHWLVLPGIGLALASLLYGVAWLIGRTPGALNVPNQEQYDALDPAAKRGVLKDVQAFLYGTATAMLVLFAGMQGGTYSVATAGTEALPVAGRIGAFALPLGLLAAALGFAWWLPRRVQRLADDAR